MNKRVILGLSSAIVLATSAFAYNNGQMPPQNMSGKFQNNMPQGCMAQQNRSSTMKMMHHKDRFLSVVMRLDLSNEQRKEIRAIIKASMSDIQTPFSAFTETNFDKEKFIKLSKQLQENRIEKRAEVMEKIYNLLDASQKKELKKIIDEKPMMRKNGSKMPQNR